MQAGFAMLSAGSVRAKNAKNIILLNLLDACFGAFAWYVTGYAFAFGDPDPLPDGTYATTWKAPFIGHNYFFQINLPRTDLAKWFFEFTFAATSATIVSGAVAERCRFESYICYNLILVAWVYPVMAHWVWSPFGWASATRTAATSSGGYTLLFGSGVYDFAGDGPVHMVGGFASLAGAWILGPRIGRFDADGLPVDMPGHNAALTLLGVFLLWFGWFGFNPGSTNAILSPTASSSGFVPGYSSIAAGIAVNTTVSAAAATIATLLCAMVHTYATVRVVVWDLIVAGNGALAGLVAITGGCAFMDTWAAWATGFIAGMVYYAASKVILLKMKIDDPLDAIAVHAVCGAWGMIACALFASSELVTNWFGPMPDTQPVAALGNTSPVVLRPYGLFMGGGGAVFGAHVVYILVIAAWTLAIMIPFFMLLRYCGILRVPPEAEVAGLDISYHGGSSYPGHAPGHDAHGVVMSHGGIAMSSTPGGVKAETEAQRLLSGAIELALAEIERRGWTPPMPKESRSDDSPLRGERRSLAESQQAVNLMNGEGGNSPVGAPAHAEGDGRMVKSHSLAELQAAIQRNYNTLPMAGSPQNLGPLSQNLNSTLPPSVPEEDEATA